MIFDRSIPAFLEANLGAAVESTARSNGHRLRARSTASARIPAGSRCIDAIETALAIPPLDLEREVLRDYGNMSAPTVFFVLDRLIARGLPHRTLLTALGPGFTFRPLVAGRRVMIWPAIAILGFVTLQRLVELPLARRNTARCSPRAATRSRAGHYPLIVALHAAWLGGLVVARPRPADPPAVPCAVRLARARAHLGPPHARPALDHAHHRRARRDAGHRGPYRFLNHPNYLIVIGEIAVLPLVFGLVEVALLFTLLNAIVLCGPHPGEDAALRS